MKAVKMIRKIPAAIAVIALAGAVMTCGCGGGATGGPVALSTTFEELSVSLGQVSSCKVEGDHLVTLDPENIRGALPPAEPVELITRGNPELKRVAITIDDGWNADMRILDLLSRKGIEWTAFLIGGRGIAESNPDFVQRIKDSGGEVCNHTYSHYVMPGKDESFVVDEIWKAQEAITGVTHEIYPYVRFSGGAYDEQNLQWSAEQGFWVVNWTVSSADTNQGVTIDFQVNNILNNLQNGAILLFHFGGYNTYEVLSRVIPEMEGRGYEVTSLSRVLEGTPYVLEPDSNDAGGR